ncbi:hypothetical protein [Nostoc piscinale]|uniref:hypothetical protein n=1 Tax=Nostoc piscinale TaxID=224012 RepID=UPI000AF1CD8C|nr:hypothetical protein [Nostoc piscinale]
MDFNPAEDKLKLGSLNVSDLSLAKTRNGVSIYANGEILATILNVTAAQLTSTFI